MLGIKTCVYCGDKFNRTYQHKTEWKKQQYCSIDCRNDKISASRMVRGYWIDKDGYAIKTFYIDKKPKNIRLHRLVMEEFLERPLKPMEKVHHKNGDRLDNRIENLELFNNNSTHISHRHAESSAKNWQKALEAMGYK